MVYVEESRSGEGNLELCLDDIIEGRWNDGVVCLRSLKGVLRFSLFLYCSRAWYLGDYM